MVTCIDRGFVLTFKQIAVVVNVRQYSFSRELTQTISCLCREGELDFHDEAFHILINHSCTPGNVGKTLTAFYYYITAMLYDLVVLIISIVYLMRYNPLSNRCIFLLCVMFGIAKQSVDSDDFCVRKSLIIWKRKRSSLIAPRLIYEGIGYFVVLAGKYALSCAKHRPK